jgi:hypothetical protein
VWSVADKFSKLFDGEEEVMDVILLLERKRVSRKFRVERVDISEILLFR